MADLLEVVFEGVSKDKAVGLFMALLSGSLNLSVVSCPEDIKLTDGIELDKSVLNSLVNIEDLALLINVDTLKLEHINLSNVLIRLTKYEKLFDIDFNIDIDNCRNINKKTFIRELQNVVSKLAGNHQITSYFAGMEPATDEDTRYFTRDEVGPLQLQ